MNNTSNMTSTTNKEKIEAMIKDLESQLEEINKQINDFDLIECLSEESYNEFLDEYGEVEIGSLSFLPSTILQECDPIAYDTGFSEWAEYVELESIPEYNDLIIQKNDIVDDLNDLRESLSLHNKRYLSLKNAIS